MTHCRARHATEDSACEQPGRTSQLVLQALAVGERRALQQLPRHRQVQPHLGPQADVRCLQEVGRASRPVYLSEVHCSSKLDPAAASPGTARRKPASRHTLAASCTCMAAPYIALGGDGEAWTGR